MGWGGIKVYWMGAIVGNKRGNFSKFLLYSPNTFTEKQLPLSQAVYLTIYDAMFILGRKGLGWMVTLKNAVNDKTQ